MKSHAQTTQISSLRGRHITIALAVLILAMVSSLMIWRGFTKREVYLDVESVIPPTPAGWTTRDLPIGATEQVMRAVNELLNYDSAVYRRYENGRKNFEVYVAYWSPGKQPPRLVAAHTPDICWVVNGWMLRNNTRPEALVRILEPVRGHFRVFENNHQPVSVIFWQMVGNEEANYSTALDGGSDRSFISEIMKRGIFARPDAQYFIRVSTSGASWDDLENDSQFVDYLRRLAALRPIS